MAAARQPPGVIDERAVEIWNDELEELFLRTGHRFRRVEPRRRMRDYIRGLLGPVGRKNGRQLAEYAGHRTPDRLQRLLNGARWDADDLRDDLQHYVAERLGEPDGILVLDDTGFLKKALLRPGNAGSNTAADHIAVAEQALAQLPQRHRRGRRTLVRTDSAGGTHEFVGWLAQRGRWLSYSVGMTITEQIHHAVLQIPASAWTPAVEPDGRVRDGAWVADWERHVNEQRLFHRAGALLEMVCFRMPFGRRASRSRWSPVPLGRAPGATGDMPAGGPRRRWPCPHWSPARP
jgi:hypothetical protein